MVYSAGYFKNRRHSCGSLSVCHDLAHIPKLAADRLCGYATEDGTGRRTKEGQGRGGILDLT